MAWVAAMPSGSKSSPRAMPRPLHEKSGTLPEIRPRTPETRLRLERDWLGLRHEHARHLVAHPSDRLRDDGRAAPCHGVDCLSKHHGIDRSWKRRCTPASSSRPRPSWRTSICAGRCTLGPRATGISAAPTSTSRGSGWIASRNSGTAPATLDKPDDAGEDGASRAPRAPPRPSHNMDTHPTARIPDRRSTRDPCRGWSSSECTPEAGFR
jgi:hypothetical protein